MRGKAPSQSKRNSSFHLLLHSPPTQSPDTVAHVTDLHRFHFTEGETEPSEAIGLAIHSQLGIVSQFVGLRL